MITGKTRVLGIIGHPLEHTLSPHMHNSAFRFLGLDYVYVPFEVKSENLKEAILGATSMNINGLNVTIPHKTEVIPFLDDLDQAAELIGAVNTILFSDNGNKGFNTDGIGAIRGLEEVIKLKNKKTIVLGAGGAARAISFQLALSGVGELLIANRTEYKGKELAKDINEKTKINTYPIGLEKLSQELETSNILINTTPVGMYPHLEDQPLVTRDMMHPDLVVNDIIYNPLKTRLLEEAEIAGAKTLNGVKMLVYQGAESFQIWTGKKPPLDLMFQSFMDALKKS